MAHERYKVNIQKCFHPVLLSFTLTSGTTAAVLEKETATLLINDKRLVKGGLTRACPDASETKPSMSVWTTAPR
jgi:hypothetical protein